MSTIEQALEKARKEAENNAPASVRPAERPEAANLEREAGAPRIPIRPSPTLIAANAGNALTSEDFRLLRGRILSIKRNNPAMSVFMITSAMRNEGKTMVSCNLAMSMAHDIDHTVLLVDADLRSPSCHRTLGLPLGQGLSDCLSKGTDISEVLLHLDAGRLTFLPAGRPIPNLTEMLSSNMMRDLLMEIKHRYPDRIVLIDTTPVLPFAETRALGRLVDGVLLVARENVTLKAHLESALRSLEGCNLLGIVYNDAGNYGLEKDIFTLSYTY